MVSLDMMTLLKKRGALSNFMFDIVLQSKHKNMAIEAMKFICYFSTADM